LRTGVLVKLVDHIDFGQLQSTESRTVGCISINFSFLPELSHVTLFLIWLTPAIAFLYLLLAITEPHALPSYPI